MVTRRAVVGAGLTFAPMAYAAGFGALGPTARRSRQTFATDALLVDENIETPRQVAALIQASRRLVPVVGIQLDAAGQAGFRRVLDKSQAIVGISSGATLFCLERIAWDHGFRLTGRRQTRASDLGDDAYPHDVAAFLSGVHPPASRPSPLARAYRPSRADGMLHAWVMQRSASPQRRLGRREV